MSEMNSTISLKQEVEDERYKYFLILDITLMTFKMLSILLFFFNITCFILLAQGGLYKWKVLLVDGSLFIIYCFYRLYKFTVLEKHIRNIQHDIFSNIFKIILLIPATWCQYQNLSEFNEIFLENKIKVD